MIQTAALLLLLCPRVQQHRLPSQPSLHVSTGNHIPAPVTGSVRVHRPQLLVALSHAVQAPQLVAQALTLLSQDVNLSEPSAGDWTQGTGVAGQVKPGKTGIRLGATTAHTPLIQPEENSWKEKDQSV